MVRGWAASESFLLSRSCASVLEKFVRKLYCPPKEGLKNIMARILENKNGPSLRNQFNKLTQWKK